MIYRDGKPWDGWKDHLKTMIGTKPIKNSKFEVADRYSGLRELGDGKSEPKLTKSTAASVGIPPEFMWTNGGVTSLIRYVEHVEKRIEGNGHLMEIEHPGTVYIRDGKFEVSKDRQELFWLRMVSPYCENGFNYDTQWQPKNSAGVTSNSWGVPKSEVDYNRLMRQEQPKYKFVDEAKDRQRRLDRSDLIFTAQDKVRKMPEAEMREVYASLGQPNSTTEEIEVIQLYLDEVCKNTPEKIIDADTENVSFLSLVKTAEEAGVIFYKKQERAWMFEGETDAICLVTKGKNPTNALVEWLRTKDDGKQVFIAIKERLKEKEVAA